MIDQKKVAVISPLKQHYATTFIQAHIDLLPYQISHLHSGSFPTDSADGFYKLNRSKFLQRLVHHLSLQNLHKKYYMNPVLKRYLLETKQDVVLAEFGPTGAEILEVCQSIGIPLIVHFHGYDAYTHLIISRYREKYLEMFDYAKWIIVVSYDMKEALVELGCPSEKIKVNHYGPREEFYNINPEMRNKIFVAIGRFVDKKAPLKTILAFSELAKTHRRVKLQMAGDGPLLEQAKDYAVKLGITEQVEFLGSVTHEKVKELFQKAFCFVQHSVRPQDGDSEGTPVAILEASAAGLPVVSTRHAGIKDVIIENESGFLVDEGDVAGMSDAMRILTDDLELARRFGRNGKNNIKQNFSMKKHLDNIQRLIDSSCQ